MFTQKTLDIGEKVEDAIQVVGKLQPSEAVQMVRARLFGKLGDDSICIHPDKTGPILLRPGTQDIGSMRELLAHGLYEIPYKYLGILKTYGVNTVRVLDVGANIGGVSLSMYQQCLQQGLVPDIVAVEPEIGNFNALQANLTLSQERAAHIKPINAGVGSEKGRCRVVNPLGPRASALFQTEILPSDEANEGVALLTISDIIEEHFACNPPYILKVDVEGAEQDIFSGDVRWLDGVHLVFIEFHQQMYSGEPNIALEVLGRYGFREVPSYGHGEDCLFASPQFRN